MPIDPSIALQARLPQFDNPLAQMAQVSQLQHAQKQNRLADLTFAGKEREMQQENALSQVYKSALGSDGAIDRNKLYSGLAQGGLGAKLPGIQKGFADQDKSQREAERAGLQQAIEKQAIISQYAGAAKDQTSWDQGLAALQSMGVDVSQVPQQFDPQTAAMLRDRSLTGAQQLEQVWKQKGYDLDISKFGYQQQNDATNRAVTMRGQNMTDARGRDTNDINRQLVGQERQLKIDKLQAEKDDRTRQKQAAVAKAEESLAVIDKAINHPGRAAATGTSSVLDPRNYIAGTEPMNFQVVLDQLGGQAFLQAFESLKGGGQITEVEGKKATDAMARLNRKQSDAEFKKSLEDLRSVVSTGLARAKGVSVEPAAPASGSSNIDALLKKYGG
jgi:hypothetical protein